jgi:hypothetical protein
VLNSFPSVLGAPQKNLYTENINYEHSNHNGEDKQLRHLKDEK